MTEVLSHWSTYVPDARYMTQRGGTFLFNQGGEVLYEYRDRGILGFAENMSDPLAFFVLVMLTMPPSNGRHRLTNRAIVQPLWSNDWPTSRGFVTAYNSG